MQQLSGIILCGGKSNRFGSNKGLALYKDRPMISYSIELMQEVVSEILISANCEEYRHFGYTVVHDVNINRGPLEGLIQSLKTAKHPRCLICPCDMPNLNSQIFQALLNTKKGFDAIVAIHNGFIEPLVGIYYKKCLPKLEKALINGNHKMLSVLKTLNVHYQNIDSKISDMHDPFKNINHLHDMIDNLSQ